MYEAYYGNVSAEFGARKPWSIRTPFGSGYWARVFMRPLLVRPLRNARQIILLWNSAVFNESKPPDYYVCIGVSFYKARTPHEWAVGRRLAVQGSSGSL